MKSPFAFITKPIGERYSNTKNIGGIEFIVNVSEEESKFSNRYAEVIELPLRYKGDVSVGDTLLVHHNVFKFYNDMKGQRKSGKSFFREDIFLIEPEQFFAYKHNNTWKAVDRYCFVQPVPKTESYVHKPFSEEPLMGIMKYPNDYLISQGVTEGTMVCFTPESEYEFIVDDEKLYRIFDHAITIAL